MNLDYSYSVFLIESHISDRSFKKHFFIGDVHVQHFPGLSKKMHIIGRFTLLYEQKLSLISFIFYFCPVILTE
jgi:hypothetical protein